MVRTEKRGGRGNVQENVVEGVGRVEVDDHVNRGADGRDHTVLDGVPNQCAEKRPGAAERGVRAVMRKLRGKRLSTSVRKDDEND